MGSFVYFTKKQVSVSVWVYLWVLGSTPVINLSVFEVFKLEVFNHYCSVVHLEVRDDHSS